MEFDIDAMKEQWKDRDEVKKEPSGRDYPRARPHGHATQRSMLGDR
jgi:hypothetical protein